MAINGNQWSKAASTLPSSPEATVRAAMELDQLGVAQHVERIVEEDVLACLGVAEEALKVRVHQRRQGRLGHAATKHCACMQ